MPRRNEGGTGRRGTARSGGGNSFSGRGGSPKKPFKRSDKDDFKRPSTGKTFDKKNYYSSGKSEGNKGKTSGGPYKKPGDELRRSTPKSFGQRGDFSGRKRFDQRTDKTEKKISLDAEKSSGKSFSKKSRFAKPDSRSFREKDPGSTDRKGFAKKPFNKDVSTPSGRSTSDRSFKKSAGPSKFSAKNFGTKRKFSEGGNDGRPKERSDSFGKPFKKSYKVKSGGDGVKDSENISGDIRPRRRRLTEDSSLPKSDKIRLNKFISNSGISSRREADELITMGLISVNGKIISELGYKVNPGDEVRYESKVLHAEKPVYILMNKPKGFITTTEDPQDRKTVMHIIGSAVKERIYPVGRLDRNTTGLLLLTNDGDLADKLMHPSFNVKKIYKVELDRPLTKTDFQAIIDGVRLEEGRAAVDDLAIVSDDGRTVGLELHIGWNRVVRRIFESLDYDVVKLDRSVYAGLDKKELGRGQWRFLTKEEIVLLKHFK